jgi:hypothetical protein
MKIKIVVIFLALVMILLMVPQVLAFSASVNITRPKMICVSGTDTLPTPAGPPERTWISADGNIIRTYNQIKVGSAFAISGSNGFSIAGTGSDLPTIYHEVNLKAGTSIEIFYKVWTVPGRGTFEGFGTVCYWSMINGQYETGYNKGWMILRGTGEFEGETLYLTFSVHISSDTEITLWGTMQIS